MKDSSAKGAPELRVIRDREARISPGVRHLFLTPGWPIRVRSPSPLPISYPYSPMAWEPALHWLRGKIVRPFLPEHHCPSFRSLLLKNLYPGDDVYIFETNNNTWARAHVIARPFPRDFSINSTDLNRVPVALDAVVVVPLSCVLIRERIPFADPAALRSLPSAHSSDSPYCPGSPFSSIESPVPALELALNDDDSLVSEIRDALSLLTSHIYALYSIGEFDLFNKLAIIYHELNEQRIKLFHASLTEHEACVAKMTVTNLLNKIPKKLASLLDHKSLDAPYTLPDTHGYKAILARSIDSSDLVGDVLPPTIAVAQISCALKKHYPKRQACLQHQFLTCPAPTVGPSADVPSHVLVDFTSVVGSAAHSRPGQSRLLAYLYVRNQYRRLTEAFAVLPGSGSFDHVERVGAGLFQNLPYSEIQGNRVFLCAVIVEESLLPAQSSAPLCTRFKKGIAAGVADISRVLSRKGLCSEAQPFSIKLFGSTLPNDADDDSGNHGWGEIIDRIILRSSHGLVVNPKAEKLVVAVKELKLQYTGEDYSARAAAPIHRVRPMLFDPMEESYERVYLTVHRILVSSPLVDGDFYSLEASSPSNERIKFSKASNQQPSGHWTFVSVRAGEAVGEKIKIDGIMSSKDLLEDSVTLTLAWNGQIAARGSFVFKSKNKIIEFGGSSPHTVALMSVHDDCSVFANVQITTEYIGKYYNTLPPIQVITRSADYFQGRAFDLEDALASLCKLGMHDLMKHFAELLRGLCEVLEFLCVANPSVEYLKKLGMLAIIHLLDQVIGQHPEYSYLLDLFLRVNFVTHNVGISILKKISMSFLRAEEHWGDELKALCRILVLLFNLCSNAEDAAGLQTTLCDVFESIQTFMSHESSDFIDDQVLVLQSMERLFNYESIVDKPQLLKHIVQLVDSIGTKGCGSDDFYHKLAVSKHLLVSRLFAISLDPPTEFELALATMRWSTEVLLGPIDIDVVRLTCSNMCLAFSAVEARNSDMVSHFIRYLPDIATAIDKYYKYTRANAHFAPKSTYTELFPSEHPFAEEPIDPVVGLEVIVEVLVELSAVFCFLARMGSEWAKVNGLQTLVGRDTLLTQLSSRRLGVEQIYTIISAIKYIRQGKFFPEDKWISLYVCFIQGCVGALEIVGPFIIADHIPSQDEKTKFDRRIWGKYLKTLLKLATLPPVATEHLSPIPREASLRIAPDLRGRTCRLINDAWEALAWEVPSLDAYRFSLNRFGGYQPLFLANEFCVVEDVLLCSLQKHQQSQLVGVRILWSLMVSEYLSTGSISSVERQAFGGLYEIYTRNSYKPHVEEKELMLSQMVQVFALHKPDAMLPLVSWFMDHVSLFINCLNNYNRIPRGIEFTEDLFLAQLKTSVHLLKAEKSTVFNSLVHRKSEEFLGNKEHVQAALIKKMLASTYTWDQKVMLPQNFQPQFPRQSSFERKRDLLIEVAQKFCDGKHFKGAIRAYTQLVDAYNNTGADLRLLGLTHHHLSTLYFEWERTEIAQPTYYRVMYLGAGFVEHMRGRQVIFESKPFDTIDAIHELVVAMYPGSRIISDGCEADQLLQDLRSGRFLHVTTVEPCTGPGGRRELRFFKGIRKLPGSSSVFDLWTEECIFETESEFPALMNRSDVVGVTTTKLSPIQNACRAIGSKIDYLRVLKTAIDIAHADKADYSMHMSDLLRQLAETMELPTNGGVSQYRKFLEYENEGSHILQKAFLDLALVLDACLDLHAELMSPTMADTQRRLEEEFKQSFHHEIKAIGRSPTTCLEHSLSRTGDRLKSVPSGKSAERPRSVYSNGSAGRGMSASDSVASGMSSYTMANPLMDSNSKSHRAQMLKLASTSFRDAIGANPRVTGRKRR